MEILAVLLARVTAITNLPEWDPRGKTNRLDFTARMVERYGFQKFPRTFEEYSSAATGAVFAEGRMGDINISSYSIFLQGLVVDTRSSTDDSERVLRDITEWFCTLSGIDASVDRITRKFYLSQLSFCTERALDALNPKLPALASRVSNNVSVHARQELKFETTGLSLQIDPQLGTKFSLPLRIERQEGSLFSENKYFSAAPLPTNEHIAFLEEFESALTF
jgi:hypothetical protein